MAIFENFNGPVEIFFQFFFTFINFFQFFGRGHKLRSALDCLVPLIICIWVQMVKHAVGCLDQGTFQQRRKALKIMKKIRELRIHSKKTFVFSQKVIFAILRSNKNSENFPVEIFNGAR